MEGLNTVIPEIQDPLRKAKKKKSSLLSELEKELDAYDECRDKYTQVKETSKELQEDLAALEYLSDKQSSNLRHIIRQKLLARTKQNLLLANLHEASDACAALTLSPEEIACADVAQCEVDAARLTCRLDRAMCVDKDLAKEFVRLKKQRDALETKYLQRMNPMVVHCCDLLPARDWTQETNPFMGITKQYDYLVHMWAARGAADASVDEAQLQHLLDRELERVQYPGAIFESAETSSILFDGSGQGDRSIHQ